MKRVIALLFPLVGCSRLFCADASASKTVEFKDPDPFVCDSTHLTRFENFPVPPGSYGKVTLDMDVITGNGPWNPVNPRGWHDLFWMVRTNRNLYMIGYSALRKDGDKSPEMMLRQGLGVQHVNKTKDIQELTVSAKTEYHVNYVYDVAGGHAVLTLTQGGKEVKRIESVPLLEPVARSIAFAEGDTLTIGLSTAIGDQKEKSPETPSLGWTYRNIRASLERASE